MRFRERDSPSMRHGAMPLSRSAMRRGMALRHVTDDAAMRATRVVAAIRRGEQARYVASQRERMSYTAQECRYIYALKGAAQCTADSDVARGAAGSEHTPVAQRRIRAMAQRYATRCRVMPQTGESVRTHGATCRYATRWIYAHIS
ncbi:hypothetical protein AVEN_235814-1 [Araneus ventricosus]|uniref:Uncharacterized protein n=1 Tax=Araneus ventricosus TaxID=182803 RepID=A0A4Y2WZ79_ARAVE|nr:hypothetical protein AVEN_235814-1 [Araneus ventricosus]